MTPSPKPRTLELLAPARDYAAAVAAITHGADAVYIGADAFGARSAAANSVEDIARVVEAARPFGVKVYVTLNTIIYRHEIAKVKAMVEQLWKIGVDALIVQDMALLEMDLPPIDLHASTQTDARTIQKIRRLACAGFSQIVVPREFTLEEIRLAAQAAAEADIEVFVHGALCVSYSGDCHAGALIAERSANRGECPQVCRMEFTLTDSDGHAVAAPDGLGPTRHWLSTADLCRLDNLSELIEAGASSFKIEGRLKSPGYVKNVTLAYSQRLNEIVAASDGRFIRSSFGTVRATFVPDVSRSFNRGFTPYFLNNPRATSVTSWKTPKWVGRPVGTVAAVQKGRLKVTLTEPIANGDGLGFFTSQGKFMGFRVNRAEGSFIYPAPGSQLPETVGTTLFRNSDTIWENLMSRDDSARRTLPVEMLLRPLPDGRVALDCNDCRGCRITVVSDTPYSDKARTPQAEQRRAQLGRLGDTVYNLNTLDDRCGDLFIPAKGLAELRRKAIEALDRDWRIRYTRRERRASTLTCDSMTGVTTTYHDNVANPMAEKFYLSHGAVLGEPAAEVCRPRGEARVMTCRYCLRRELGACLKTPEAHLLPRQLWLENGATRLRLDFDCANCRMQVYLPRKSH